MTVPTGELETILNERNTPGDISPSTFSVRYETRGRLLDWPGRILVEYAEELPPPALGTPRANMTQG